MNILSFLSYAFVTSFTPGPNNIMSMLNAGKYGVKKAIGFNIGVSLGFLVLLITGMIFGNVLYSYLPAVKPYLTYIGAAYILYLAYKILKSDYKSENKEIAKPYGIRDGFLLQFVNPKGIIYTLTIITTFILPYYSNVFSWSAIILVLIFIAFASTLSWATFGSAFQKILQRHTKVVNIVMALILVLTALSLFF